MASLGLEQCMPGVVQPHTQPCAQIRGRQGMSTEGHPPLKAVIHRSLSSTEGRRPPKIFSHQRSSSNLVQNLIPFKSECGTAQLSLLLFVLFSWCSIKLIHLNDLLDDVTFPQAKLRWQDTQIYIHTDRQRS